eukprot:1045219-Pleurochrysis_carterae.AAC.1
MGVACIAAAGAGVLQLSNPGVLASVGCAAGSIAAVAVSAALVSRVPPLALGGLRSSIWAWGSLTGA